GAVGDGRGGRGDGCEHGAGPGGQAGPGAVDRPGDLPVAAGEVAGDPGNGDVHLNLDGERAVAEAILIGEIRGGEGAVRNLGQGKPSAPFTSVQDHAHCLDHTP